MRERPSWWRIAAASGPLRFLALVFALAALLLAAPPVLRAINRDSFRAPVDEIRDPEFAIDASDEARAAALAGKRYHVVSWEPEWREECQDIAPPLLTLMYTFPNPAQRKETPTPEVFGIADAIGMPDGSTWKAVAIVHASKSGAQMTEAEAVRGEVLGPDLQPMPAGEIARLCARYRKDHDGLRDLLFRSNHHDAFKVVFECTGGGVDSPGGVLPRDARTGWMIGHGSASAVQSMTDDSGGEFVLREYVFPRGPCAAGPCAIWFDWPGEALGEIAFAPHGGQTGEHLGNVVQLATVAGHTEQGWMLATREGLRELSGDEGLSPLLDQAGGTVLVLNHSLPPEYEGPVFVLKDGSRTSANPSGLFVRGIERRLKFEVPFAEIDSIRFEYRPHMQRVAARLPFVPGSAEENRSVRDFTQVRISEVHFDDAQATGEFLLGALQSFVPPKLDPNTPPATFRNATVAEIFQASRPKTPHAVVAVYDTATRRHFTGFAPPGEMRRIHRPKFAKFADFVLDPSKMLVCFGAAVAAFAAWAVVQSLRLKGHLRRRAYTIHGLAATTLLWLLLGRSAWSIPQAEELGTIPGVDVHSVRSIVQFMAAARSG